MGGRKELTIEERKLILNLYVKSKKSYAEISKLLGKPKSTVQTVINRFQNEGRVNNKPRTGRKPKLSDRDKRYIKGLVNKEPTLSAPKITADVENNKSITVHPQTVRRALAEAHLHSRTARKKPCISAINRKKRIEFAKKYLNKTDFWRNVIFSDESKFNIFGSDGRMRVWRRNGEALNPKYARKTVKHGGGSVMVWGCMAAAGVGQLEIIAETMNQYVYMDILKKNLKESANKLGVSNNFYFQQDNDPKHTAHNVKMWLAYNTPHLLESPPQSPDLNPIEHLWDELERKIRTHQVRNKEQLKHILLSEWDNIDSSYTQKLVGSMHNRLLEVIKMKGYATRY